MKKSERKERATDSEELVGQVRERYARFAEEAESGCCSTSCGPATARGSQRPSAVSRTTRKPGSFWPGAGTSSISRGQRRSRLGGGSAIYSSASSDGRSPR